MKFQIELTPEQVEKLVADELESSYECERNVDYSHDEDKEAQTEILHALRVLISYYGGRV